MGKIEFHIKKRKMHPLMCWDIILDQFARFSHRADLAMLATMKEKYGWNVDFNTLLGNEFDALIITDTRQRICWTNKGFEQMTGYTSAFVRHKKPSFFQGKGSSPRVRQKIREAIATVQPVKASLINYRKDGVAYKCTIQILPLKTIENKLVHFLAIQKQTGQIKIS